MPSFAEQLIAVRKAAGMTQEDLAAAVHVTRTTISSWERGRTRPNLAAIRLLSQALSFDFLTGEYLTADPRAAGNESAGTPADESPAPAAPSEGSLSADAPSIEIQAPEIPDPASVPEIPAPPARRAGRLRPRLFFCAAAILLTACVALLLLLPRTAPEAPVPDVDPSLLFPEEPAVFTREWFQGENRQYEGEPYLNLTTSLTVKTENVSHPQWCYSLVIDEVTGRRFRLEQIDEFFFNNDTDYDHTWGKANDLWAAESGNAWRTEGLNPVSDAKGIGYIVYGFDACGRKMSFRTYLPFNQ